ncbi:MAG: sugar transferase [Myxococcota bacterium]
MQEKISSISAKVSGASRWLRCEGVTRDTSSVTHCGYEKAKRALDLVILLGLAPWVSVPFATVAVLVKLTSRGPVFFVSDRVGKDEVIFRMFKFRTMNVGTPAVATHLLEHADSRLTPIGGFLRRTSLDELPQLINIAYGDMSIVGPRPALYNQDDLIALRRVKGVNQLIPGLTGWAQINGRDEIAIPKKVELDAYYLESRGTLFDVEIILKTIRKVLFGSDISH